MKPTLIIANLKAELDFAAFTAWQESFFTEAAKFFFTDDKKLVVCPSLLHLVWFTSRVRSKKVPVDVGAQDVSAFPMGTYTGETAAQSLSALASYAIIGHSERRHHNYEDKSLIQQKILEANKAGLKVILCAESPESYVGKIYALAYEPSTAVGSGVAADPQASYAVMSELKSAQEAEFYLYGGSVNKDNVQSFLSVGFEGVLVGRKSLDPTHLFQIVLNS